MIPEAVLLSLSPPFFLWSYQSQHRTGKGRGKRLMDRESFLQHGIDIKLHLLGKSLNGLLQNQNKTCTPFVWHI